MDISRLVKIYNSNEFYATYQHKSSIYRMSLKIPEFPSMKNSNVNILRDLHDFTVEYTDSDDIYEFFKKFDSAVSSNCEDSSIPETTVLQRKREEILNELALLSRNEIYDITVASDLTQIRISDKTHHLHLTITNELDVVVSDHSLPECKVQWFQSSTGKIESYLGEFTRAIEELDEFFDNINTIDELCFVVDPVHPSTKINWRIFKIDQKCFVKVVIDPLLPSSVTVSFIGPTLQVEQFRNRYEQEVSKWEYDLDVHKNLLKICGLVYFPMRDDEEEEETLSCSICGLFRLNESIPMISCDNIKCDLIYHVSCLKQWWSMFTETKTFLYVELGTKCPMCKEKLSTSFDQLINE